MRYQQRSITVIAMLAMMLKFLLLTVVAISWAQALQVSISYSPPVLGFTLPLKRGIGAVVFHFMIKNEKYKALGFQTSDGWQFMTRDVSLDSADAVYAYAVVYDVNGNKWMTTQRSALRLDGGRYASLMPAKSVGPATIFIDDFNSFDISNWQYEVSMYGGMNGEFQVYTNDPKNVFTRNGNLYLYPILTIDDDRFDENFLRTGKMDMDTLFGYCTNNANYGCTREGKYGLLPPVMSGKVKSVPTLRYGTVEVRARIPKGDWLWPGIWMLPRDNRYGGWPRSGEIDIMESRGNTGSLGVGTVTSTLHWGTDPNQNRYELTQGEMHTRSWHDNFHTWRLEWTLDHITTYVDNMQIMKVKPGRGGFWQMGGFSGSNIWQSGSEMAPFDQDFYMIFNVAVGGTNGFFPDNVNWGVRKPWSNNSPQAAEDFWNGRADWGPTWQGDHVAMEIDYVEFKHL